MTLQEFCTTAVHLLIAAARRGEAPLSGAIEMFAELSYADRRKAGKFAKRVALGAGCTHQTGTKGYKHRKGRSTVATFA